MNIDGILKALLLGNKREVEEEIASAFNQNGLSHIIAISGMHVGIAVTIINFLTCTIKKSRLRKSIKIIVILIYWAILDFSPSSSRAIIMIVFYLIAELLCKKSQNSISIAISILFILLINPFYILDTGFILSFGATIGIIYIYPLIKGKVKIQFKSKIINFAKESFLITISVYSILFPIITILFKKIPISFIFTSILITPISYLLIILGNAFLFLPTTISRLLVPIINLITIIFLKVGNLKILTINIISFSAIEVIIYYSILSFITVRKVTLKKILKKIITITIIIEVVFCTYTNIFKSFHEIYFIDVGQGDSLLIVTKLNKKILIDGGGSEDYDMGEKILVPYLLSKQIYLLDYVIISHFDTDHVGGIISLSEKLRIKNIIIGIQPEESKNLEKLIAIIKNKKTNVIIVYKGERIDIERGVSINVLWPNKENIISKNKLNNNSLVCKINLDGQSILATGDIEEVAEREIVKEFEKTNMLSASILKVAHHGSKTSSSKEFIKVVKPKIALIGVGKNNKFGHPNEEVLKILEDNGTKVYRTDEKGEIKIYIKNGVIIDSVTLLNCKF